uniref:Uncharacterized protein n=1 Tax=Mycena chlorophos TaxID=658473 RepID=A0ABQ0LRR2_MYCCL|nr:predicted protein [Mycena chlorophos]
MHANVQRRVAKFSVPPSFPRTVPPPLYQLPQSARVTQRKTLPDPPLRRSALPMVAFISPDKAGLLSTVLESILYGFSLLMYGLTMWVLLRTNSSRINKPMVVVSCLLFIFSSIHIGVDINRLNTGFISERDAPGGPPVFFGNPAQPSFVFKNAIYTLQTVTGDGVVIYRCFMVWRRWWIIVLPCILWCGVAVAGAGSVYTCTTSGASSSDIYALELGRWIKAFYSTTLACNFTATALLAFRLWTINKGVTGTRVTRGVVLPVLLIVIDSGALYSSALVAALTCFALGSNGQYVVLDMVTPIISIAFYMVILRVGMARGPLSNHGTSTNGPSMPRIPLSRTGVRSHPHQGMKIQIEVQREDDTRHAQEEDEYSDTAMKMGGDRSSGHAL